MDTLVHYSNFPIPRRQVKLSSNAIDINAILAEVAAGKASSDRARKNAQLATSGSSKKSGSIVSAQKYQTRAQNFDGILSDYSNQINDIARQLGTGVSNPSLQKELTKLVDEYNSTIKTQTNQYTSAAVIASGGDISAMPDSNGNIDGIAPTIVFDAKGKPVKNPDGSYKTEVVDKFSNVNGVAPTIVFDKNGKPIKNPDGSFKTQIDNGSGSGKTPTQEQATPSNATIVPYAPAQTIPVDQNGQLINSKQSTGTKVPTPGNSNALTDTLKNTPDKTTSQIASGYGAMGSYAMAPGNEWMLQLMVKDSKIGRSSTDFANDVQYYTLKDGTKPWDQIDAHIRDSSMAYYDNPQQWARTYNTKLQEIKTSAIAQGLDPSVFGNPIDTNDSKSIDAAYKASSTSVMGIYTTHYYGDTLDPTVLSQWVSKHSTFAKTDGGVYAGVLGQNADTLKQYASDMGVAATYLPQKTNGGPDTGDYFANAAKAIQDGTTNLEEQQNYIKQQAMSMYQPFAQRINEGLSVRALASPYLNAASNLMEVSSDGIDLGSNTGLGATITKAMRGDGTTPVSLDAFQTQVKKDPAWLLTGNARNSIMDTASQLLGGMGLVN